MHSLCPCTRKARRRSGCWPYASIRFALRCVGDNSVPETDAATKIPTSLHHEDSELQRAFAPESTASVPVTSPANDHPVLTLQRAIGNYAVQQTLSSWSPQP